MNLNPVSVAKFVVSGVVGIGTGKIVGKIIKNNVNPETLIDKITVGAAAWVIGGIATERTKNYTNDMIDDVVKSTTTVINDLKIRNILAKVNRGEMSFEESGLNIDDFVKNSQGQWTRKQVVDGAIVS